MLTTPFFDRFLFLVLVAWGATGISRAIRHRRKGSTVFAVDRERAISDLAVDALAACCLVVWSYFVISLAWGLPILEAVSWTKAVLFRNFVVQFCGVFISCAALWLYATAVRQLGGSWRLGIDRDNPGSLITTGVYRWSRHPVYLAFDLIFLAALLATGRVVYLLLLLIWLPLMHSTMLREERFLAKQHGPAYDAYCARVGRYFSWKVS